MLFNWLKQRRRRNLLATPFPQAWLWYLQNNLSHYTYLNEEERAKLRDDLRVFIAEKNWEGCGGLQMTDEIRVTIAAQACLLILAIDHDFYKRVPSILVYPNAYREAHEDVLGDSLIVERDSSRLGEAWYRGPVILSWADVRRSGNRHGMAHNTVIHEFAHQLDFLDGQSDGTPPLANRDQSRKWRQVMTAEYNRLLGDVDRGRRTLLDPYGATDEAEFFAVASECFFEQPVLMAQEYPRLYDLLREYYHQDPAWRIAHLPS